MILVSKKLHVFSSISNSKKVNHELKSHQSPHTTKQKQEREIFAPQTLTNPKNYRSTITRLTEENERERQRGTLSPRSRYLMATDSPESLSFINLASPKLPDPILRTNSYRSLSCIIGRLKSNAASIAVSKPSLVFWEENINVVVN